MASVVLTVPVWFIATLIEVKQMGDRKSLKRISKVPPLPPRPADGHKGLFGRVLVVGGSEGMIGAPTLAGTAALIAGAGLVQIAVPRAILPHCLTITPELTGLALDEKSASALRAAAELADTIVVGPGMGQSAAARARLHLLIGIAKTMVVDADALNLLSSEKHWPRRFRARAVLTPHPGEMKRLARLLGVDDVPPDPEGRVDIAAQAAQTFGQTIVLKGHHTVVTDGQRLYINQTGDSTLSKAGSGDVLSGLLGCLLAQMPDVFEAAQLAVYLHGLAGELAGEQAGRRSALAMDVIASLADVMDAV